MAAIPENFGSGGGGLTPNDSAGTPTLVEILRDIADDLANNMVVPAWDTGIAVAAHTVTLPNAGTIVAVEATTAGSTGPKAQVQNGAPAAGQVDVSYTAGVPTLTFAAADAVTAIAVMQAPYTAPTTTKA